MRLNVPMTLPVPMTHEGAPAARHVTPEQQLRRSVLSCLLWEGEFYEGGESIAARIRGLCGEVAPATVAALAVEARSDFHLRHVPLWLMAVLAGDPRARGTSLVSETLPRVIQRADELAEFVAVYAKANGVEPGAVKRKLSAQVKKGLARAFVRFDAYGLAKYDRAGAIRLRDVMFMVHPKPRDDGQAATWKASVEGTLPPPDTWEVALSGGADKRGTWERLLREGKLGRLATLKNLRNMDEAGVEPAMIDAALCSPQPGWQRVLPFRYIAAMRAAPRHVEALDEALRALVGEGPRLAGQTVVLVDVSGSMDAKLSARGDLTRADAAAGLAAVLPAERLRVFSFSNALVEVPAHRGLALVDAVLHSQPHQGTALVDAVAQINGQVLYDRLIVVSDEQAGTVGGGARQPGWGWTAGVGHGPRVCPDPRAGARGYMVNVASARHGVGYGPWLHLDGFSERIVSFIREIEAQDAAGDTAA